MSGGRDTPSAALSAVVDGPVEQLLVVFGDQLDDRSPAFDALKKDRDAVLLAEVKDEATHVPSHRQRTTLFLSAMRHFALSLLEKGWRVRYVKLDDAHNTHSFDGEVRRACKTLGAKKLIVQRPGEHRVMKMAAAWKKDLADVDIIEDAHFLNSVKEFGSWARGRKSLVMESFYREQRRRLDVLVGRGGKKPAGGEWNFDKENRKAFKSEPDTPRVYRARPDGVTKEVMDLVSRTFPDAPGRMETFGWGVTRAEAKRALTDFVEHRLADFGPHQDAMWTGKSWLNHSLLSPYVNLHLLSPMEMVEPAVEKHEAGEAPLNSVEGFVRQVIGWREFIRGVYWSEGADYGERNGLGHHGDLPGFYWTGETEMNCVRDSVGQVLDHGYGHHIQRLMVTGNFALIAGVHPRKISDWYLGMYVDAVDWVTLPNTLGMAVHADGGIVGTKPYAASASYIKKMSNACAGCRYDPGSRTGEDACPFNTFYWDFLIRHEQRFSSNPRMNLMMSHVHKMSKQDKVEIRVSAEKKRDALGVGDIDKGDG
ncbi:MAG: cryptochrome/photolyase family protein [Phycisphaerales bacterium]